MGWPSWTMCGYAGNMEWWCVQVYKIHGYRSMLMFVRWGHFQFSGFLNMERKFWFQFAMWSLTEYVSQSINDKKRTFSTFKKIWLEGTGTDACYVENTIFVCLLTGWPKWFQPQRFEFEEKKRKSRLFWSALFGFPQSRCLRRNHFLSCIRH